MDSDQLTLSAELVLGQWLRCGLCGERWDRYARGYKATITGHTPEGDPLVKFDCPSCHSWHVHTTSQGPHP